ncbi:ATP-binding protein [Actinomadura sp. CNU-125]|uniref:ATP-binding protein n=1 Tax=Actinomadura sp. CNU-125 TaxID=1904961 RepID=UPI000A7FF017|nr:ATP-binding protein [Actinomadura sp. CNU-125]
MGAARSLPARPESSALARRFVRGRLEGAVAPDVADTAVLLVSELVTNAVLHARTQVEVSVRVAGGGVRARVADRAPRLDLVPQRRHPYADTGRGLYLVEQLASRHGVDMGEHGKTVWFELGRPAAPSGWERAPHDTAHRAVTLVDVPWALCMAAQQHRYAVLREFLLASAGGRPLGIRPDDLRTAHDVNNMIGARLLAAAAEHPSDADIRTLPLSVPADAAPGIVTLRRVLDLAEEAARGEHILSRPSLPQTTAMQDWMLDEIIGQLGGGQPIAWTVVPRDPTASPLDLMPWDSDQVQGSRLPTIAVDDANRIIAVNESVTDLLGWSADELVGERLTMLVPEHLRERHVAAFTSLLLTGRPRILGRAVPLPALHSDGRPIPIRLLIQSQELHDGRTVFVAQLFPRTAAPEPSERAESPEEEREPERPRTERRAPGPNIGLSPLERLALLTDCERALSAPRT